MIISHHDLKQINPGKDKKHKYSQCLYQWLSHNNNHSYGRIWFTEFLWGMKVNSVKFSEDKNQMTQIYFGSPDEHFLSGACLNWIIRKGRKEVGGAYTLSGLGEITDITDWFWAKYLEIGKCAFDPEHTVYWDTYRYTLIDKVNQIRKCQWCGREEKLHLKESIGIDKIWAPIKGDEK